MAEKPYKLRLELELAKGYDDLEKQTIEIYVDSFSQATEVWKTITGVFQQHSKVKAFEEKPIQ